MATNERLKPYRPILHRAGVDPKVAMTAGVAVGIIGAAAFAYSIKDGAAAWGPILLIGSLAGFCGGLTWWRIEKPYLDRLNTEGQG